MTLEYVKTNKNVVFYRVPGLKGSVRFLTSQFAGTPPTDILVEAEFASPKTPKVKETKEQRKARLAARTPEQVVADAEKRAAKMVENARKNAAKLATV